MTQQRMVRPGECLAIAAVSTSLSVAAHGAAGGQVSALSAGGVAVVSAFGALAAFYRRRARVTGLVALLLGNQLVGHVVMHLHHMPMSSTAATDDAPMGHHGGHHVMTMSSHPVTGAPLMPADAAMGLIPSAPMLIAHVAAAVATAALLAGAFAAHTWLARAYRRATLRTPASTVTNTLSPVFVELLDLTAAGHRDLMRSRGPPLPTH